MLHFVLSLLIFERAISVLKAHIVLLQIWKFDCVLVSVHLKATGLDNEDLGRLQEEIDKVPDVVQAIQDHYPGCRR